MHKKVALRAQADFVALRTEKLYGRDHLVVPVIALVQGVLQGMNAEEPELALASEFGKFPAGWDGRPIVMNHPVIDDVPVSANNPTILEEYAFGQIFNATVDDDKLKVEAWLDLERVKALGGEFESTVERIKAFEDVEVSTGLFTETKSKSGRFNGRAYSAVWYNVVPDHLAILSAGSIGACSVADGCGAPRANKAQSANAKWRYHTMLIDTPSTTTQTEASHESASGAVQEPKANCTCGGSKTTEAAQTSEVVANGADEGEVNTDSVAATGSDAQLSANSLRTSELAVLQRITANLLPNSIMDGDIRKLLQQALRALNPRVYAYLIGFTGTFVVYERYDSPSDSYTTFQRNYTISADRTVTLDSTETPVNIFMEIVPVKTNAGTTVITANQTTPNQESQMSGAATTEETKASTPASVTTETTEQPKANTTTAPAPVTLESYLANAPVEMREMLESGIKLHNDRKATMIKALKDSGRCKFDDAQLKTFSIEMLENLVTLAAANTETDFSGRATPRSNAATEDDSIPPPPRLFSKSEA